jgi:hypothetical protein
LDEIEVEPDQADLDGPKPGRLPRSWLDHRAIGSARAAAQFAAVGARVRLPIYVIVSPTVRCITRFPTSTHPRSG